MNQQQLSDLITNTLGPIVDAAGRLADRHDRNSLNAPAQTLNLEQLLAKLVYEAREAHAIPTPAAVTADGLEAKLATRAGTDWDTLVNG